MEERRRLAQGGVYLTLGFFLISGLVLFTYYSYFNRSAYPFEPAYGPGSYIFFQLDILIPLWLSLLIGYLALSHLQGRRGLKSQ